MAEYLPLLERAVAGLKEPTAEARKGLYDRARSALLGQLRGIDPPIAEEEIQRESVALDEAISRIEAKFRKNAQIAEPPPRPQLPPPARTAGRPIAPARAADERNLGVRAPARERPAYPFQGLEAGLPRSGQPARSGRSPDGSSRGEPPGPAIPERSGGLAPRLGPVARVLDPTAERTANGKPLGSGEDGSAPPIIPAPSFSAAPRATVRLADGVRDLDQDPELDDATVMPEPRLQADADRGPPRRRGREPASLRPAAPIPKTGSIRGVGSYVLLGCAVLVVAAIATAAYRLRDRPEEVAAAHPASPAEQTPSKIVKRVDGSGETPVPDPIPAQQPAGAPPGDAPQNSSPAPISQAPPEAAADTTTVPAPIPQGSERAASGPQTAAQDSQPAPEVPSAEPPALPSATPSDPGLSNAPAIGVSQRAGMLVDAPEEPQKVKTFQGQVVWRAESVSAGQGQPLSNAVRADVEIPDAKLTMSMVLKKNLEPQFPASHTIEFHFTEQPGNTLGPIKQINVPDMRLDDAAPNGDPLVGVPVAITDDYFLVGLSRGAAEQTNTQLIEGRNWIDLAVLLASGKIAKVTFEKGPTGQKILEDAIASWR